MFPPYLILAHVKISQEKLWSNRFYRQNKHLAYRSIIDRLASYLHAKNSEVKKLLKKVEREKTIRHFGVSEVKSRRCGGRFIYKQRKEYFLFQIRFSMSD